MADSPAAVEPACGCTTCTGLAAPRCEDCGGHPNRPAARGGCICDGPWPEPYWATV